MRISSDEEMKVAAESFGKPENVIDVTVAASSAPQPEARSAFQVLKIATKEYCFVKDTAFNEPEFLHELETSSVLQQNMNLMLAKPPKNTRSARVLASSDHVIFAKRTSRTMCRK